MLGVRWTNVVCLSLQGIISIEERLRRMREALRIVKEALKLEKEAYDATEKELEYMRALLMGMG